MSKASKSSSSNKSGKSSATSKGKAVKAKPVKASAKSSPAKAKASAKPSAATKAKPAKGSPKASAAKATKPTGKTPAKVPAGKGKAIEASGKKAIKAVVTGKKIEAKKPETAAPKAAKGGKESTKTAAQVSKPVAETKLQPPPGQSLEEMLAEAESAEELVITDADGRRFCRIRDCDQLAQSDAYCRFHYIQLWKHIQGRRSILSEGKLERYIEELTARYPDKFLEILRKDLRVEKDFLAAIAELEIDESAVEAEFEEDENQSDLYEVQRMSDAGTERAEDDSF